MKSKELPEPPEINSLKNEIYRRYFKRKLGITSSLLTVPSALVLCALHIMLITEYFLSYNVTVKRPMEPFEYSGIGIVAAVVCGITVIIKIKASIEPSFILMLLTTLFEVISIFVDSGLVLFVISSPLMNDQTILSRLKYCKCVDVDGKIRENSAFTLDEKYICSSRSDEPDLLCEDMKTQADYVSWERSVLWTMVAAAGTNVIISIIPCLMAVKTILMARETFDKTANLDSGNEAKNPESLYVKYMFMGTLRTLGWLQLGFVILLILEEISINPRLGQPWNLTQLFAIGSYAVLNSLTMPGSKLSYLKLLGASVFHFVVAFALTGTIFLVSLDVFGMSSKPINLRLYPFISIQVILSGFIFGIMIRALLKIDQLSA